MIEPESFYSNEQTSYTNHYQNEVTDETPEDIAEKALTEFHNLKNKIVYPNFISNPQANANV